MPNQPKTPGRSVRVPDPLWEAAKAKTAARGETVTDVVVRALNEYTAHSTWLCDSTCRLGLDCPCVCHRTSDEESQS